MQTLVGYGPDETAAIADLEQKMATEKPYDIVTEMKTMTVTDEIKRLARDYYAAYEMTMAIGQLNTTNKTTDERAELDLQYHVAMKRQVTLKIAYEKALSAAANECAQ